MGVINIEAGVPGADERLNDPISIQRELDEVLSREADLSAAQERLDRLAELAEKTNDAALKERVGELQKGHDANVEAARAQREKYEAAVAADVQYNTVGKITGETASTPGAAEDGNPELDEPNYLEKTKQGVQSKIDDWVEESGYSQGAMIAGALATAVNEMLMPTEYWEIIPVAKLGSKAAKAIKAVAEHAPGALKDAGGRIKKWFEGKPDKPCLSCVSVANPVNPLHGVKLLEGDRELDFVLDAPLPLVWQRTYASSNAHVGWLGQGWSLPLGYRLEVSRRGLTFIDSQGRKIRFAHLAQDTRFFSKYEHLTLSRTARNQYEVADANGLRFVFGLSPLDLARLAEPQSADEPDDGLMPQAKVLVLQGFIDRNHNHLRLYYENDGLPRHLDTSSGRRIGFVFDRGRPQQPRLTHVVELLGQPNAQGHYPPEQQQWLVEYRYSGEGDLIEVRDGDGQLGRRFAWQNHMMVEHAEPGGLVSRYEWDQLTPKGRVLKNSLSTGESWRFIYIKDARQTLVIDGGGRETRYHYDGDYYLIGFTDAAGGFTEYRNDAYGNRLMLIDPAGHVTRYHYDTQGNLIRLTQPDGAVYLLAYHAVWRKPVAITDPLQRTTRYRYDERGNLVEITEADGTTTEYRLDARGLPKAVVDARGGLKTFDFDAAGRLLTHTDCSGNRTQYSYDSRGRLASVTDALGQNRQYGYQRINRRDRLSTLRHADGATERFAYDNLGRLIAHHDPLGQVTRYQLDAQGRPLERIDALGHRLRYQYDLHGRLSTLHNENNAVYRFGWDVLDRLVAEQGFDGRRIDYRYDRAGNLIESADGVPVGAPLLSRGVDAPLLRTRYQRDVMGRLLDKFSSKPGVTTQDGRPPIAHSRFAYDDAGQLVRARNGQARVELYYNQIGQLSREVLRSRGGLSSELQHRYDPLGNRESTTLPDGRVLNTLRYGSGHVHQINLDFQVICDFERDALHREVGRSQGPLSSRYERDPLGRLLQSQAQLQAHGQAGEPLVGGGQSERDKASQGQRIARRYQYELGGQLKSITDRRQGTTQYGYDVLGRLLSANAPHAQEQFAFDPAHNLMQADEARQQEARLQKTTWSDAEWAAYVQANLDNPTFNPLLTPAEAAADPSTWGESKPNRLRVWEEHRYAYDAWGNCIEKKSGPHSVRSFEWDAEHQLSRATVVRQQGRFLHAEHWGYDYDPFGRRIAKYRLDPTNPERIRPWLESGTTHFSWDGNRLLLERQGDKQTLYLYEPESFVPLALVRSEAQPQEKDDLENGFPLPQEWLAFKDSHPQQWNATVGVLQRKFNAKHNRNKQAEPERPKSPVEVFYVHTDHLGTPRELTDSAGHIVWAAAYKAWGSTAKIERPGRLVTHTVGNTRTQRWEEQSDPIEQNLRFQGQYFDLETGLHYNRFRYYDPDCGRFVSQDPIGLLGGVNNYQYAPNPVGWIDPFGLCKCPNGTMTDAEIRAREIHEKVPPATQSRTTIAVTETKEGVTVISSSEPRLRPSQRAELKPGEVEGVGLGHAEVTGVNHAKDIGLNPTGTAASRPICSNCQIFLEEQKIPPLSPLKP